MSGIPPILLLLYALTCAWAIYFPCAYFMRIRSAELQFTNLQVYVSVSSIGLLVADLLLVNDTIAFYRLNPMYVFPTEHAFSTQKVALNFAVAFITSLIAWLLIKRKSDPYFIPPLLIVLPLSFTATVIGLFYKYVSTLGFCCESPWAVFAGFPFSMAHGIYRGDNHAYVLISQKILLEIGQQHANWLYWEPRFPGLFINLLFWTEAAFLFILLVNFFRKAIVSVLKPRHPNF